MSESNAVESDGLTAELFLPELVVTLPRKDLIAKGLHLLKSLKTRPLHHLPGIPLSIGLLITNRTLMPLSFDFNTLRPPEIVRPMTTLTNPGNLPLKTSSSTPGEWSGYCIRPEYSAANCRLVEPQASVVFILEAMLVWLTGDRFGLSVVTPDGFHWFYTPLEAGAYWVRLTYAHGAIHQNPPSNLNISSKTDALWSGQILTPFKQLQLVNP